MAKSPTALDALQSGQLSLTEAAALREFEDDPRAVEALVGVAGTASFDHRVAQLRQDRVAAQARTEAETSYADRGFTILAERPQWRDTTTVLLRHLRTADGDEATEAVVTDPSRWAVFMVEEIVLVDATNGEPVDEDEVDWSTEHHSDRQPAEGTRHADSVVEKVVWQPEYYCRDPHACGLTLAEFLTRAKPIVAGHHGNDTEDAEARDDAKREQRRKVLALNKLGAAAQEVRRAWVRDRLLARKTPVKGAAVFVATCLDAGPGLLADHAGRQIVGRAAGPGRESDQCRSGQAGGHRRRPRPGAAAGHGAGRVGGPHPERRVARSECHVDTGPGCGRVPTVPGGQRISALGHRAGGDRRTRRRLGVRGAGTSGVTPRGSRRVSTRRDPYHEFACGNPQQLWITETAEIVMNQRI